MQRCSRGGRQVYRFGPDCLYPRGGGKEPDTGEIEGVKVVEVTKQAEVVGHTMKGRGRIQPEEQNVHGTVKAGGAILLPSTIQQPTFSTQLLEMRLDPGSGRTLHLRKKVTAGLTSHTILHLQEKK